MVKLNSPRALQTTNILLILFGCAIIGLMSFHHSLMMDFWEDPLSQGIIYGYYLFLNPYIKIVYALGLLIIISKEFFLDKPIKSKVKINMILGIVLPLLFFIQIIGWYYYLEH